MRKFLRFVYQHCYIIFLASAALLFCFQSPFPFHNSSTMDSNVFMYIGKYMSKGLVPYRDMFDHKGPLLYILNWLGLFIGNGSSMGIWLIELIFMEFNIFLLYKTALLFTKRKLTAVLSALVSLSPIILYFQGGNLVQEYALPFLLASLYFFSKYFMNGYQLIARDVTICGSCCGAVLLLQPNMTALWVIFCVSIILHLYLNGRDKELFTKCVLPFILGLFFIFTPVFLYLFLNDALPAFWESYITFNLNYSGKQDFASKFNTLQYFYRSSPLYFICVFICAYGIIFRYSKPKIKLLCVTNLAFLFLSLITVSISGYEYAHYGIVLIPCLVFPVSELFSYMLKFSNKTLTAHRSKRSVIFLYGLICCSFISFTCYQFSVLVPYTNYQKSIAGYDDYTAEYLQYYIDANTEEEDKILVIGNYSSIYLLSDRQSVSKYFYQAPIADIDMNITNTLLHDIDTYSPTIIIDMMPDISSPFKERVNTHLQCNVDNKKYTRFDGFFDNATVYQLTKSLEY